MVISWGAPGQKGAGHVNLRSKEYVVGALAPFGFVRDATASAALSRVAHYPWFRHNVQVFRRAGAPGPDKYYARLVEKSF